MTVEHIQKLIKEGEGFTIEFKECTNSLNNSVFETVCSFSNRYGGHMLIGVHDSGEILGVNPKSVLDIKNNFVNVLNNPNKISPTLMLSLSEVIVNGRIILYVYVPQTSQVQFCSGRIYDRNYEADIDITNSGELAAQLISQKSGQFTERKIFPYATLEDIRIDLIPVVKQLALSRNERHPWKDMSEMELFRSAGLYEEDKMSGKKGFNLAGILLFGKDEVIQSCAPGYVTDCLLRRENTDRYDDRVIVETNLIDAYDKIFGFIEKHTLDRFFIIGSQSVSIRSRIAREIVSNILAHREYTSSYRSRLIIEKDRIVTDNWNRPQFEGRIDPNDFTPRSKNPLLAKFFVNIGRADELGSGVRNLYEYTKIYSNGGEPELIEGNVFKIIIPLTLSPTEMSDKISDKNAISDKLTDNAYKLVIMKYLSECNEINTFTAEKLIGRSSSTARRILSQLVNDGVLRATGANKIRKYELNQ